MRFRAHVPLFVVCLALASAHPARAQLSDVNVRLHSGVAKPSGSFNGFYDYGVSIALDAAYPLGARLDLVVDLGLDYVHGQNRTYVPNTHLWRMLVDVEGDLLGSRTSRFRVRPFAGVGAQYFHTKDFQIDGSTPADRSTWSDFDRRMYPGYLEKIKKTSLAGNGGLRVALDAGGGVTWWLSGGLTWSPVGDSVGERLRRVPLGKELGNFGSATDLDFTLGFTVFR